MPLTNIRIENWVLSADCTNSEGTVTKANNSVNLVRYFGVSEANFIPSHQLYLDESDRGNKEGTLTLSWRDPEDLETTDIKIERLIGERDGKMIFLPGYTVNGVLYFKKREKDEHKGITERDFPAEFIEALKTPFPKKKEDGRKNSTSTVEWAAIEGKNIKVFYVKSGPELEGRIFTTIDDTTSAAVFTVLTDAGHEKEASKVEFSVIQATVSRYYGQSYIGAEARINLVAGKVGIFDASIGLGVAEGLGIRNDSIEIEMGGVGITIGKRLAIQVAGSEIGLDFSKLFACNHSHALPESIPPRRTGYQLLQILAESYGRYQ
ncbi:hypothetical protein B0H13DRAFT_1884787 [Mycena leptocephala]|nr:hypothetical protein B0H13DRAFT_1884787 [Mycena leptocephala]